VRRILCSVGVIILLFFFAQKGSCQIATIGGLNGSITTCYGVESANQEYEYFTFSGINFASNFTITASSDFLVSKSSSGAFTHSLTILRAKGFISDTIYVRLGPTALVGNVSGAVTVTSADGTFSKVVAVNGFVSPLPTVNPVKNIAVLNGTSIPDLVFSGTGNTYTWTNDRPDIGTPANGVDSVPAFRALINGNVPVTATVTVSPVSAGMAYVMNNAAQTISVINTFTNTLDTTISSGGNGPVSETLSPDYTKLYVLNIDNRYYTNNNVAVINTATNKIENIFSLPEWGLAPASIALNSDGTRLYVLNFMSGNISVINTQTGAFLGFINIDGAYPSAMAVSPDGNYIYVTNNKTKYLQVVSVINVVSNTVVRQIPIVPGAGSLLLSPDTTRIYTGVTDTISVVNTVSQSISAGIKTGGPSVGPFAITPDGSLLYAITGTSIRIYNAIKNTFAGYVVAGQNPGSLCMSPDGSRLYITFGDSVAVVNTATNKVIATTQAGGGAVIDANCVKPGGCIGNPTTFTITVNPGGQLPDMTEIGELSALTTVYGTPSVTESFTVSGVNMRDGITVTAPKGFEVSLDNTTFSSTVTLGGAGAINTTTVYIRIAATTPVGSYLGTVVISSSGAANIDLPMPKSTVTPTTLTVTADNKTKAYGAVNPPLTITYTGFVNDDGTAQLVYIPVANTTAATNSPVGQYPITPSDGYSPNYNIIYVPGILTITPDIVVPNAFTPNGDGINDTWNIQKIGSYPRCTVQVFNRYGGVVFSSVGYGTPWNGTYDGAALPTGTYYYIINLKAGVPILSGYLEIIR